jgi:hypothetical protein
MFFQRGMVPRADAALAVRVAPQRLVQQHLVVVARQTVFSHGDFRRAAPLLGVLPGSDRFPAGRVALVAQPVPQVQFCVFSSITTSWLWLRTAASSKATPRARL